MTHGRPLWLTSFIRLGDRRAVYEELLEGLPKTLKYSMRDRLDCALAVAGIGPPAESTLGAYWPHERPYQPLFSAARDYMPRILALAAESPHARFRGHAIHVMPAVSRAEFATWGFDDTTMPLPQRAMIAAKLGEFELFSAMVVELAQRAAEAQRSCFVFSPPLTLDYLVGPEGPFIFSPCGGKGDSSQRITVDQLFNALTIPFDTSSEQHSARFSAIFGKWKHDGRDLRFPCQDE